MIRKNPKQNLPQNKNGHFIDKLNIANDVIIKFIIIKIVCKYSNFDLSEILKVYSLNLLFHHYYSPQSQNDLGQLIFVHLAMYKLYL
ncbi:hypothetical protein AC481_06220 [miscellaneous Crenarchaeota group archaeon SMTZ-80]|nr:MAG: hypothetical protein AC481_06220 [miscellaneous Crenarchaeota group archaeon SMTZ-80]